MRVHAIEDLAPLHRETNGERLRGVRWSRATPVKVRRVTPSAAGSPEISRVWDIAGLRSYNEAHRLFA